MLIGAVMRDENGVLYADAGNKLLSALKNKNSRPVFEKVFKDAKELGRLKRVGESMAARDLSMIIDPRTGGPLRHGPDVDWQAGDTVSEGISGAISRGARLGGAWLASRWPFNLMGQQLVVAGTTSAASRSVAERFVDSSFEMALSQLVQNEQALTDALTKKGAIDKPTAQRLLAFGKKLYGYLGFPDTQQLQEGIVGGVPAALKAQFDEEQPTAPVYYPE